MAGVDEMYMENLDEWIYEENKVVTYKYLSRSIKCHVNVAKQMLFNFVEEERKKKPTADLGVVYLVSGLAGSESGVPKLKVMLVPEQDLETVSKSFEKVLSRHIYSVQKNRTITSTGLFATDQEVFREDVYGSNAQTAIRNRAAVPRLVEQIKVEPPIKKEPAAPVVVKKETTAAVKKEPNKTGDLAHAFANARPKKSPEKSSADAESKKPTTAVAANKSAAIKKGAANNIASMFAKQASKPKQEEKEKPKENKDLSSETSPGKENLENQRLEDRQEEDEEQAQKRKSPAGILKPPAKKAATTTGKKRGKPTTTSSQASKRKRITVASDSESEGDDESDGQEEERGDSPPPPQAKVIHSDEEDEDVLPATPQDRPVNSGRRRVKKLVDKTYLDEQGYMVTKKEVEYVSEPDDDEPELAKKTTPPPTKVEAPAAKKMKTTASSSSSSNPKQPGIMNFFKKK